MTLVVVTVAIEQFYGEFGLRSHIAFAPFSLRVWPKYVCNFSAL